MTTGSTYKDGFLSMAEEYRGILSREGEPFLFRLANEKSVRDVLCTVYGILKDSGRLTDLAELPEAEKQALKAEARRLCRRVDVPTLMDVCRALHALGTYCMIQNGDAGH